MTDLSRHQRRAVEAEARKAMSKLSPDQKAQMAENELTAHRIRTRAQAVQATKAVLDTHQIRVGVIKDILEDTDLGREFDKVEREAWLLRLRAAREDRDTAVLRLLETLEDLAPEQEKVAVQARSDIVTATNIVVP